MDEMEVKIGAIRTAKLVRYVLDFIGFPFCPDGGIPILSAFDACIYGI